MVLSESKQHSFRICQAEVMRAHKCTYEFTVSVRRLGATFETLLFVLRELVA